jgi:hypothetical protein
MTLIQQLCNWLEKVLAATFFLLAKEIERQEAAPTYKQFLLERITMD